jgi:hypothetical protein
MTSDPVSAIRMHGTGQCCSNIHRFEAVAVFYPNFYPKGQPCGVERLFFLLFMAAKPGRRPGCVTSLPSWSCGFDSRRPLRFLPSRQSISSFCSIDCRAILRDDLKEFSRFHSGRTAAAVPGFGCSGQYGAIDPPLRRCHARCRSRRGLAWPRPRSTRCWSAAASAGSRPSTG